MCDFDKDRAQHQLIDAAIVANLPTARGYFELVLEAPGIAQGLRPGQFVHVRCRDSWVPMLRRPLSVLRADPVAGTLSLLIQVAGVGTELLSHAKPGDVLSVLGPLGNWFVPGHCRQHLLVCGGVGVVPMLPLARELVETFGASPQDVTVLYGAASAELFSCLPDFEAAGCTLELSTDDGSRGHHGFVTELLEQALSASQSEPRTSESGGTLSRVRSVTVAAWKEVAVYVCGPTPMMKRAAALAAAHNAPCQVSLENRMGCGMGVCLGCVVPVRGGGPKYLRVCREGPVFDAGQIAWEEYPDG
ncbi:MAG: dihydroorotate dehydrogenase electron transfer subunit [Armatimonadetes bacterium CG_4_10_14_3_um_filter_66_18]|nr:dihydroorotate dehydrogenase electron transfer subunit [Armatimonadota bacterium]PIU94093.1 MAG: dihydroorotate dehydrogenase electron transfer subunit [Armatimonadetes bacterium CG06_land_8_20_14_3_00_66_21]PIW20346.1 MAG: dihydroorotate dehydrogenase electron transfer subunit [Armatimonadetes bacterium CG17_big_fil_post_rev_8_21_14_2_50_66_6]PIX46257.1 MAG: dihydroorotate dehydrogenase electron transfer subunit [Armatimonadetes bacterium CG_4_8_14_3_um_filter_66_20]PIY40618.1 MAG: dihydroo